MSGRMWWVSGWSRSGSRGMNAPPGRAVAQAKARWRAGHRRTYRPWITEPGMWWRFDWAVGPMVAWASGAAQATLLLCLWLAWSRSQVVIPT